MIDDEFRKILAEVCPDEITARLAVEVLNLRASKNRNKEIRGLIARYSTEL